MAYLVTKTINNGYRCCCHSSWDSEPVWFDTKEAALAEVYRERGSSGEYEIEEVHVADGVTGKEIAVGILTWGRSRAKMYRHSRWAGNIEGVPFDEITGLDPGEAFDG